MTRTDQHRPAEFVPEDYEYVGCFQHREADADWPEPEWVRENRANLRRLITASTTTAYHNAHQCDHCGASIMYVVVFLHLPTGDHLAIGGTCAEGRFTYDKAEYDRLRKTAQLNREHQRILKAWTAFRADTPVDWSALDASTNPFVVVELATGRRYGSLSERQVAAIVKTLARDAEREAQAEDETPKGVVAFGRQTVTGIVLGLKMVDTRFGYALKMLVETQMGGGRVKVYGSAPTIKDPCPHDAEADCACDGDETARYIIRRIERGDEVTFTAAFEQSNDDPAFGFFKRPTKGSLRIAYTCDECSATVHVGSNDDPTVPGWQFSEDGYFCPAHALADATRGC